MSHDTRTAPPRQSGLGWTVRIPSIAFLATIKPSHYVVLTILEWHCRTKSYTWASNATLAKLAGYKTRQIQVILAEMESAGLIYRLAVNPDKPTDGRAGIFLHRRLDPDLPVEEVPPPPEAVERLWQTRAGSCAPPAQENAHPPCAGKCAQNKDVFSPNEEEKNVRTSYDAFFDLTEKAEKRFGVTGLFPRVRDAVKVYGAEWVGLALDVPKLRSWPGVLGTLKHWRDEGGPVVKARPAPKWRPPVAEDPLTEGQRKAAFDAMLPHRKR